MLCDGGIAGLQFFLDMAVVTIFKTQANDATLSFPLAPQFHLAIQFLTKFNENMIVISS